MPNFARPLHTNHLAFDFLCNALSVAELDADAICVDISKTEVHLQRMNLASTLESEENRRPLFKSTADRELLRTRILNELIHLERIEDEDQMRLGVGGAKPKGGARADAEATIIIGLPASGKSFIAKAIADMTGSFLVDSDYAKRKFPEFPHDFGASLVHKESSLVTFGRKVDPGSGGPSLFEYCISKTINMVIPMIGAHLEELRALRDALTVNGYRVHLVLVRLDRVKACKRALTRYLKTKRYVPLAVIFDIYSNEPTLTYYRTRDDKNWASVVKLCSEDLEAHGPKVVVKSGAGPVDHLLSKGLTV